MTRHTELVKAIIDFLTLQRIPCWKMNTGAFVAEHKGKVRLHRFGSPGMADILACVPPEGRFAAFEVKVGRDTASENQTKFLKRVTEEGRGIAAIVRSVNDVAGILVRRNKSCERSSLLECFSSVVEPQRTPAMGRLTETSTDVSSAAVTPRKAGRVAARRSTARGR